MIRLNVDIDLSRVIYPGQTLKLYEVEAGGVEGFLAICVSEKVTDRNVRNVSIYQYIEPGMITGARYPQMALCWEVAAVADQMRNALPRSTWSRNS